MSVYTELRWQSAAKNVEKDLRHAADLAARIADDSAQSDEVREVFSTLYAAIRGVRTESFNAQVALGLADAADRR